MSKAPARQAHTEARVIEIDTQRVLTRKQHHFAVIDIGSNSLRLVVYDDLSRAPFPALQREVALRSRRRARPRPGSCRPRGSSSR